MVLPAHSHSRNKSLYWNKSLRCRWQTRATRRLTPMHRAVYRCWPPVW